MRRLIALSILLLAFLAVGTAADAQRPPTFRPLIQSGSCAGAISWRNARRVVGRYATIRGPVVGTTYAYSSNGSPTFLNLGADYPSSRRVSVVIWGRNRARFGAPESRYRGRRICVRGYIATYRGVPEIEARSPAQIRIVG